MPRTKKVVVWDAKQYDNTWKSFNNINWMMDKPLSSSYRYDNNTDTEVGVDDLMKLRVPLPKGGKYKIAILYHNSKPVLFEPIVGKRTVGNILKALERGLNKPIIPYDKQNPDKNYHEWYFVPKKPGNWRTYPTKNEVVYSSISKWLSKQNRLDLIKKYEDGKLLVKDLLGDHKYFEGINREGSILHYGTGS